LYFYLGVVHTASTTIISIIGIIIIHHIIIAAGFGFVFVSSLSFFCLGRVILYQLQRHL